VITNTHQFIGCGEYSIGDSLASIGDGRLFFCIDSRDFIVFIESQIELGRIKGKTIFNVYCTSTYLPYVENFNIFRKALSTLGPTRLIRSNPIDFDSTRLSSGRLKNKKGIMIPVAVAPLGKRGLGPVIVPNDFTPFEAESLNSLEFIFTQFGGGCLHSDFYTKGKFYFHFSLEKYGDILLLSGMFSRETSYYDRWEPRKKENEVDVYKTFLGSFSF